MSARDPEARLQDYLDGRMDDEAKARFEAELRDDEDLAARLAAALEVRRTLRDAKPEPLAEAFYTRARARFEAETRAPRRVPWGWVGLAGATLLAAALFIPMLDRGELSEPMVRDSIPEGKTEADAPADDDKETSGAEDEIVRRFAAPPPAEKPVVEQAPTKRQAADEVAPPPAPKTKPAPPAIAEAEPEPPAAIVEEYAEPPRELSRAEVEALSSVGYVAGPASAAPRAYSLGAASADKKAESRDEDAGRRDREVAARVGGVAAPTRTVTLLTVDGVERCEWIVARRLADRWQLVREVEIEGAAATACAIDLPLDGLPVWLDGRRVDEP